MDWSLYDKDLRHEKVKVTAKRRFDARYIYSIVWYIYVYKVEYICYNCKEKCYTRWQTANYKIALKISKVYMRSLISFFGKYC